MSLINTPLRALFDALLYPFRGMSPWVTVIPISLVAAVVLLLIFKRTSNQDAINDIKARIASGLFEIRLFNDDLRTMFVAQGQILRRTATYMRLSLVPMLWSLPPLVLIIAQLQFHYGYEPFEPGSTTQLHAVLKEDAVSGDKPAITVNAPAGVNVIEPPVWVPSLREMVWRVDVSEKGSYDLGLEYNGETENKRFETSDAIVRKSPFRVRGFLDELLYPAEPVLPADSAFESITIDYVDATMDFFGFGIHWLIVFFILSIAFAFALKKKLGVTI